MIQNGNRGLAWLVILLLVIVGPLPLYGQDAESYRVERYALANYPVSLAFAPDGRLFYTEKATGNVRVIEPGGLTQFDPVIHLDTDSLVERGMLGIALDPDYASNGFIWVFHTAPGTSANWPANQIVRFREQGGVGSDPKVMFSVPITNGELKHNGGNLVFDAQGRLYVSFGDNGDARNAQDISAIQGKIHRFQPTSDGLEPAVGNPFPQSSVYAYGLRNPFDFTLDPFSGQLLAAENGYKCDDEIDLILPGMNYGWGPEYGERCFGMNPVDVPDYQPPLLSISPTIGMTGITVYSGAMFPGWDGDVLFCDWNRGNMQRARMDDARAAILSTEIVDLQGSFCRTDVVIGPEGAVYFADPGGIYRLIADE